MARIIRRLIRCCSDQRIGKLRDEQIFLRQTQESQRNQKPFGSQLSVIRWRNFALQRTLDQSLRKNETNRSHRIRILMDELKKTLSNMNFDGKSKWLNRQKSDEIKVVKKNLTDKKVFCKIFYEKAFFDIENKLSVEKVKWHENATLREECCRSWREKKESFKKWVTFLEK